MQSTTEHPGSLRREWSTAEIEKLIWLWKNVQSIKTIAGILGRSTSAIQTQASRRSLAKRLTSKEPADQTLSKEQSDRLRQIYRDTPSGISILGLSRVTDAPIETILSTLLDLSNEDRRYIDRIVYPVSTGDMRNCLRCGRPFSSEGAHNRICSNCKSSDDWLSDL